MSAPWTEASEASWRKEKRRVALSGEPRCTVAGCVQLAINDGRCYRHVFEYCERCGRERLDRNDPCDNYDNGPRRHKWVKRLGEEKSSPVRRYGDVAAGPIYSDKQKEIV